MSREYITWPARATSFLTRRKKLHCLSEEKDKGLRKMKVSAVKIQKIGTQCVHVSTARLNVGFRQVRGCYDWRVDLELGLHEEK